MIKAGSPLTIPIPSALVEWAAEVARLNADIAENLLASEGIAVPGFPHLNLYGGLSPVQKHVDMTPDDVVTMPEFPIWGLLLAVPDAHLEWDAGFMQEAGSTPIGIGSVYVLDPAIPHAVTGARGPIAFLANWGFDPRTSYRDPATFADHALSAALRLREANPDPARYMEIIHGLDAGELSGDDVAEAHGERS